MVVFKQTIKPGDGGRKPKKSQTVSVHYTGYLEHVGGTKFDSSLDRGQPFKFKVGYGEVIRGWEEGIVQMGVGEKATLTISPDYAYGEHGQPPNIPPNATLVFEIELLKIFK